jgi:hypothetical protein
MITCKNYDFIPQELKQLKQWVCCNDTLTKLPLDPNTLKVASVDNPNTWGTYELAVARNTAHIGFVFTANDPYCVIDLDDKPEKPASEDDRQLFQAILKQFDTCYTEISQSGCGVHIITKGPIFPGCHKGNVELYSKGRYMIFTGNVLGPLRPIEDESDSVIGLHNYLSTNRTTTPLLWLPATLGDNDILRMAGEARNGSGEKFQALWRGCPQMIAQLNNGNGGQSEADNSLLSLLAFYSQSDEQVIRLFRQSALGKRDKAYRDDYIHNSLEKIRGSFKKPYNDIKIDFVAIEHNTIKAKEAANNKKESSVYFPKGLVGDIAQYIFDTSKRPVREISLTASMALVTSIVQRAYNISHTGLNQYFILIAGTGRGKEEGRKGIKRIIKACREELMQLDIQSIVDDFVGAGGFESGQGLVRNIADKPCSLSMLGEFGDTLAEMTSSRVNPNIKRISTVLRDVYNQSGHTDSFIGSAYADLAKNIKDVKSPNLTIYAEGAIDTFYDAIEQSQIANGLLPRFLILEYEGKRVYSRKVDNMQVPRHIIDRLKELYITCYSTMKAENVCEVQMSSEAEMLLGNTGTFDNETTDLINDGSSASISELWNRSHLKAMKLAAMMAVCENSINPCITKEQAEWSINLVKITTQNLISKFESGEISHGDSKQDHDFKKEFIRYLKMTPAQRQNAGAGKELSNQKDFVPYSTIKNNLKKLASFKNVSRGETTVIDSVFARMVREQVIIQIDPQIAIEKCGCKAPIYSIGPEWK